MLIYRLIIIIDKKQRLYFWLYLFFRIYIYSSYGKVNFLLGKNFFKQLLIDLIQKDYFKEIFLHQVKFFHKVSMKNSHRPHNDY